MKKAIILKTVVAIALASLLIAVFALGTVAAPDVKITYKYDGKTEFQYVESGKDITLFEPDMGSLLVYGWADAKGNFYAIDETVSVTESTTFNLIYGKEVSTENELLSAVSNGYTYIKLLKNITLNQAIELGDGVFVIDTGDFTLDISSDGAGIIGKDTGVVFTGNGQVNHVYANANPNFVLDSFVSLSPKYTCDNVFLVVDNDVTVSTNIGLLEITTGISRYDGALDVKLYGSVLCDRLVRTNGISNGNVQVFEGADISTSAEYFFDDISQITAQRYITMTIYGGRFTVDYLNGYAQNSEGYKIIFPTSSVGKAFFSKNISSLFAENNYNFSKASDNYYKYTGCSHNGYACEELPSECDKRVTINHKCYYCEEVYPKEFPRGIGHTEVATIKSDIVATEKETKPGYYAYTCKRCGNERLVPFYPDPSTVYVTAKIRNETGIESLRVPADKVYSFNDTTVMSFTTMYIETTYKLKQENIISIELPLGTTTVFGSFHERYGRIVPSSVFYENQHLEEVVIPETVRTIKCYAFCEMEKLKLVTGLEHVTTIEKYAFSQKHSDTIFNSVTINAALGEYAFKNVRFNSITFGSKGLSIGEGAFCIDLPDVESLTKEIFVEGNTLNGVSLGTVMTRYNGTNQQFGDKPIVYTDHQYNTTVYEATCVEDGYTHYVCPNCGHEKKDNFTTSTSHNFVKTTISSTCSMQGYDVMKCTRCKTEDASTKYVYLPTDPTKHTYSAGTAPMCTDANGNYSPLGSVCTNNYYLVGKCECGAINTGAFAMSQLYPPLDDGRHNMDTDNPVSKIEPTCGSAGEIVLKCKEKMCTYVETRILNAGGDSHEWGDPVIEAEPNCVDEGLKIFTCTFCNTTKEVVMKPDGRHDWVNGAVLKEPTENSAGLRQLKCTRCNELSEEGIPRLTPDEGLPVWALVLICVGAVLLAGGIGLTIYFTLFKKKRASDGYKYKFNTLGK